MNINQIKSLASQGESNTLEFKTSTSKLSETFSTVCAFLNNKGGTVLIGVTDDQRIIGQHVTDNTRRELARELNKIEPPDNIEISYVSVDGNKQIIAIEVKAGKHTPYIYDGRPYWREESSTHRMSQQRYDQLVAERVQLNFSWEKLLTEECSIADLDHNLIMGVVRQGVEAKRMPEEALRQDISKILEGLKLTERNHIKNAAVTLFVKEPFPTYPQCQLKMARFKGLDRSEFLDSDHLYGNVFALLDRAMLFTQRHLPLAARIEPGKLQRVETPLIPYKAIREALINSLCHRDYMKHGGSIALAVYDDRMEISNHGGLLPTLTIEQIKSGFSELRNPLIAEVFYRCNMIERWGRGVPDMIKSCVAANDPEPEFATTQVEFKVIFRFPKSIKPPVIKAVKPQDQQVELSLRQQDIVAILANHQELQMKEILTKLKNPPAERTLRDDLAALRKAGIIGSKGHARTATWFLKNE